MGGRKALLTSIILLVGSAASAEENEISLARSGTDYGIGNLEERVENPRFREIIGEDCMPIATIPEFHIHEIEVPEQRVEIVLRENQNPNLYPFIRVNDVQLFMPVGGLTLSDITNLNRTQSFGARREYRNGHHQGIDIEGLAGTEIMSCGAGVVVNVGMTRDAGNYIVVQHSPDLFTFYAHLGRGIKVRERQWIPEGEIIGYMGNTGHSSGPHLHLEIRRSRYGSHYNINEGVRKVVRRL